ncbi:MAG TPA: helix-turn-helix domain-containing protein [Rhodanobacter sp.]
MTTSGHAADMPRALQELGFTEYEARAYVAMAAGGEFNGYALAKASGIPRANIYAVAGKLVQRGAARRVERTTGVVYVATRPDSLLRAIETTQRKAMSGARSALSRLAKHHNPPAVLNLRGDEVLDQARQLIEGSHSSLYIALQPSEAVQLAVPLREARERGVAVTTLCLERCEVECGGCVGDIHRCHLEPSDGSRWLLVVADARVALLGYITEGGVTAVLTEQPLVVDLTNAYIQQSTTLALLGTELAGRFEGLLSAETRRLLDGLCPTGNFLAHMRELSDATSSTT